MLYILQTILVCLRNVNCGGLHNSSMFQETSIKQKLIEELAGAAGKVHPKNLKLYALHVKIVSKNVKYT